MSALPTRLPNTNIPPPRYKIDSGLGKRTKESTMVMAFLVFPTRTVIIPNKQHNKKSYKLQSGVNDITNMPKLQRKLIQETVNITSELLH